MPSNKRNFVFSLSLIIAILVAFGLGFYFGKLEREPVPIKGVTGLEKGQPPGVDFSLFWDSWRVLQEKYVDREKLDIQEMVYGAISGVTKALEDPYTVFLKPEDAKIFKENMSGEFEGVGMEIGMRNGNLTVIAPLENTPAQRAGLRAEDKIVKINGTSTQGITIDRAVKWIRGPKGTEVTLTIVRDTFRTPKDFTLVRDIIEIPSLKWELKEKNIAYIKLYHFSGKASSDFRKAAIEILKGPAEKIILDLRNNPGGYLEVAQDIAGWFLKRGQVVVIEDFGEGKEKKEYKAKGNGVFYFYPVVVLINRGSASGSEILAGALRDNRDILLIGESSFGKGSVQELEELKSSSSLKVTIAKWLTPSGKPISGIGLSPDVKIEMTEKDYEQGKDPQLDRALEIIKEMR